MKSILLFSAGKESIYALHEHPPDLLMQFNYGQKSYCKERDSVNYYGHKFSLPVVRIDVPQALTNIPAGIRSGVGESHVYMRNLLFLTLAANYALTHGYGELVYGAVNGPVYNDGDVAFAEDLDTMFRKLYGLRVTAPAGNLRADQVGEKLMKPQYDMAGFWSCDGDGSNPMNDWGHCGVCAKCRGYLTEWANRVKMTRAAKKFYETYYGLPQAISVQPR